MTDIYEDALADAKLIREKATERATKLVIEEVAPKIKHLIERELLSEAFEEEDDDDRDMLLDIVDDAGAEDEEVVADPVPEISGLPPEDTAVNEPNDTPVEATDVSSGDAAALSLPDEDGKVVIDIDALHHEDHADEPTEDEYELTGESIQAFKQLLGSNKITPEYVELRCIKMNETLDAATPLSEASTVKEREVYRQVGTECERLYQHVREASETFEEDVLVDLQEKLESIYQRIQQDYDMKEHFNKIVKTLKDVNTRAGKLNSLHESKKDVSKHIIECFQMLKELNELHESLSAMRGFHDFNETFNNATVLQVENSLAKLYKEIRQMARKNGKLVNEQEVMLRLSLPDELEVEPTDLDVTVVEAEPEGDASDDGMGDLDLDVVDAAHDEEKHDVEESDYLLKVDLPGDEDVSADDVEVEVVDDEDEHDEHGDEEEEHDMSEMKFRDDDIIEIDEAALVAEMKKMRRLREEYAAHAGHGPGEDLSDFGDGDEECEPFVDDCEMNKGDEHVALDENDLSELDDVEEEACAEGDADKDGKHSAVSMKEAKQINKIRAQLAEANLLNVKLVALNRLLQVPGLNQKARESIVETLDKGRSQAEVRKLYEKLAAKLKERSTVNESAKHSVLGTSSRVVKTSSPSSKSNSDPILERWARIAGTDNLRD